MSNRYLSILKPRLTETETSAETNETETTETETDRDREARSRYIPNHDDYYRIVNS